MTIVIVVVIVIITGITIFKEIHIMIVTAIPDNRNPDPTNHEHNYIVLQP
jgi:hypothetical protein